MSLVDGLSADARDLYERVKDLPIISPHGHCDASWWAKNEAFPDPAHLLIVPDHYVFRMLYSQGVPLKELGIGVSEEKRNPRAIFKTFASHWECFLGTPTRSWLEHTFSAVFGLTTDLSEQTADQVFDQISECLDQAEFRPRALFENFNIEVLATTDAATDQLEDVASIREDDWSGRVIPTFRPDSVLNPGHKNHKQDLLKLAELTNCDVGSYSAFLNALRLRRNYFVDQGATATDHDIPNLVTNWLEPEEIANLHDQAYKGVISEKNAVRYYGHMLVEMAQMSVDDGLVMQLHAGSTRNTNHELFKTLGPDMGADIPRPINWVTGIDALLNRVGNNSDFKMIAFTLDESTYARELAPMAGHWPCMRLGPPWWFHDSLNGMLRYFDQTVETAGYSNLAGFNDDTRAFLSIPARHDTWRTAVSIHLADQVKTGRLNKRNAEHLARRLSYDLAAEAYNLQTGKA